MVMVKNTIKIKSREKERERKAVMLRIKMKHTRGEADPTSHSHPTCSDDNHPEQPHPGPRNKTLTKGTEVTKCGIYKPLSK